MSWRKVITISWRHGCLAAYRPRAPTRTDFGGSAGDECPNDRRAQRERTAGCDPLRRLTSNAIGGGARKELDQAAVDLNLPC
jgi:hypothetical protein